MLLADWSTQFLPPLSAAACGALAAAAVAGVVLLRWLLGPANAVSRRWPLWLLRGAILALVAVVLVNPVRVDELPGPIQRPEMFYLLDTSSSMATGSPESRWEQTLGLIRRAEQLAPRSPAIPKAFRFGQRLAAIRDLSQFGPHNVASTRATSSESDDKSAGERAPVAPTDGDTRLLAALKQISTRFGRVPPLGIVVFSDGRSHDEADLDRLAADFARLHVPIHVAPLGDANKGGDVVLAALVAPQRARKFTEIEVQVFIRSYGYDGRRTEVQLLEVGAGGHADRQLASQPVTLESGFQSVSLTFRSELATHKLRAAIPPLADEISDRNNQIEPKSPSTAPSCASCTSKEAGRP